MCAAYGRVQVYVVQGGGDSSATLQQPWAHKRSAQVCWTCFLKQHGDRLLVLRGLSRQPQ
jgi:hypothetical protein